MPEFNSGEFMVEPTIENFNSLRKDDLVTLGKHLGLEIRSTLRKREVYDLIKEHFVKEKTFEHRGGSRIFRTSVKIFLADGALSALGVVSTGRGRLQAGGGWGAK